MFLIRFADMPKTRHVSAVRNVQMSARRGADSQDSPATRHPKADVLSQSSVRTNDSCGLQYCEYSICRDKKDSISAVSWWAWDGRGSGEGQAEGESQSA